MKLRRRQVSVLPKPMALVGRNHAALHSPALPVVIVDQAVHDLAGRMYATMLAKGGLALAAPQVGVSIRMVVARSGEVLFNPSIEASSTETATEIEECLSIPGRRYLVTRPATVTVHGLAIDGLEKSLEFEGTLARMWQHEIDHLEGVLICDRWPEQRGVPAGLKF